MKAEILGAATLDVGERPGLPLYLAPVEAGFPSPAEDYLDQRLDLHNHLVTPETATFFLRAHGESMLNAGIHDGDLLVVDRAVEAEHNKVMLAALDAKLMVKRLAHRDGGVLLVPENPDHPKLEVQP